MSERTKAEDEDRKTVGKEAEQYAADWLLTEGYTIRERNWRPRHSHELEVDIIAQQDNIIAFVEVKARSDRDSDPADAVTEKKMNNMIRAARIYLTLDNREDLEYRFDIIAVSGRPGAFTLEHYPDAFMPHTYNRFLRP